MKQIIIKEIQQRIETDESIGKWKTDAIRICSNKREEYIDKVCKLNNNELYVELMKVQIPSYMGSYSKIDIFKKFVTEFMFSYKLKEIGFLDR